MALAENVDDVVAVAMGKWAESFATLKTEAMAALYLRDTLFYGAAPALYRGVDGVRDYFNALFPTLRSGKAEFSNVIAVPVGADVINVAAIVAFTFDDAPPPKVFRLTQVLVREGGGWKIFSHHVSPKATESLLTI